MERSSEELTEHALQTTDDDEREALVAELQRRGTDREMAIVRKLFDGEEEEQRLACDILGQLGWTRREGGVSPFADHAVILLRRALRSPSPSVQHAAIIAAGHMRLESVVPLIIALATSRHERVRWAAAFALGGRTDDPSLQALVALSADRDDDVRNWATFGLGTQCERRDPFVRDALFARIADPHPETRGEAWVGLAEKGDRRALAAVRESLESGTLHALALKAAGVYADPSLVPALERWVPVCAADQDEEFCDLLESALLACRRGGA